VIQAIFLLISALGILAALGTVLARNLVHAALYLIAFFFTVACQFVLLEAEFLAALQVLVYIGAVSILMMFGIMLTRNIQGDDTTIPSNAWKVPGMFAGLCLFIVLVIGMTRSGGVRDHPAWNSLQARPSIADANSPRAKVVNDMARWVGIEMMSRYVIAFETAGLLLTAALVGAIALAHREDETTGPEREERVSKPESSRTATSSLTSASS
jgi:NADH-quinone oxidoreductase subunit J